eukprot:TRINITY_DN1406_c0_g6_i1.p1 TRINITY_DN1406_c0_g6~~TRINITY_DN1406_c0_g6_i1.p1  ORF type:complete len:136 (-),score=47.55 TRINITY_DN1406_c0_g6_i1:162-539(-)
MESIEQQLRSEKQANEVLSKEVKNLRQKIARMSIEAEATQDRIANKLLKRIHDVERQKADIASKIDVEEEHISNMLQTRIDVLTAEKNGMIERIHNLEKTVTKMAAEERMLKDENSVLKARLEAK